MQIDTSFTMQAAMDRVKSGTLEKSLNSASASVSDSRDDAQLKEACRDFEALFIKQMFTAMDKTVDRQGLLGGGGMAEEYFRDMLFDSYSEQAADTVKLGIADMMYRQMQSSTGV